MVLEMLITLLEAGKDMLWKLINEIYESREIPTDVLNSISVAIPKKSNALECEYHRTIS